MTTENQGGDDNITLTGGAKAKITFSTLQGGGISADGSTSVSLRSTILFGDKTCIGGPDAFTRVDGGPRAAARTYLVMASPRTSVPIGPVGMSENVDLKPSRCHAAAHRALQG